MDRVYPQHISSDLMQQWMAHEFAKLVLMDILLPIKIVRLNSSWGRNTFNVNKVE